MSDSPNFFTASAFSMFDISVFSSIHVYSFGLLKISLYYLKEDLHSIDHIFVPINANNKHWILCVRKEKVICHCIDKCFFYFKVIDFITQKITCYDSLVESHLYSCQAISSDMQ